MRLLEVRADPVAHFLPTKTTPNGTFFCAAPPGLPPALAEMFMFPTTNLRRTRAGPASAATPGAQPAEQEEEEELRTPKRARISAPETEEPEVEYGMRRDVSERAASERPFVGDVTLPISEGLGALGEDQPFDFGDVTLDVSMGPQLSPPKSRAQSVADDDVRSRYSTPGPGQAFDEAECAIAAFDYRVKSTESQTQTSESDITGETKVKGVSKNTAKALQLLQARLQPDEGGEEKVLSFAEVSIKVRSGFGCLSVCKC